MSNNKGLPKIFLAVAFLVLVVPFTWKFAPALFGRLEKRPSPAPPPMADLSPDQQKTAAEMLRLLANSQTTPPPTKPDSEDIAAKKRDLWPEGTSSSTPSPTPASQASASPLLDDVADFIDSYFAAGNSDHSPLAEKPFFKFPIMIFYDQRQLTEDNWTSDRIDYVNNTPNRQYDRIGPVFFLHSDLYWETVVPIRYRVTRQDGTRFEGITLEKIVVEKLNGNFRITAALTLCKRTLSKNGAGVSAEDWRSGRTAYTNDGNVKLRYVDSDSDPKTILRVVPAGSPIKYIPEDKDWLITKDESGVVGFMCAKYMVR